jgi:hypothetical protein
VRGSELTNRNRATRKAYIRSHPVMVSFMVSIAIGGTAAVFYPRILHGSSPPCSSACASGAGCGRT